MSTPKLFTPLKVGDLQLQHRVVLAPLTRRRAGPNEVIQDISVEYYKQRSSTPGTLLITEATQVSRQGQGYTHTPGIFSPEQQAAWKNVTDAVHANRSYIFAQLWHTGRLSHSTYQENQQPPVSSSAVRADTVVSTADHQYLPAQVPRALEVHEIKAIVEDFKHGAQVAKDAGFDGIELHAANGYLIEQFLKDGVNKRTDQYGGSVENRARFLLEILDAVLTVFPSTRVALRLSPLEPVFDTDDSDPLTHYTYIISQLNKYNLAYLHLVEPRDVPKATTSFRPLYKGILIGASGYERDTAIEAVENGDTDLVAFGRHFISNPDLPLRLKNNLPLNPYDRDTFYGGDAKGYTDYPFYKASQPLASKAE